MMTIESICFTTLAIVVILIGDILFEDLKIRRWSSWTLLILAFIGIFFDGLIGSYYGFYLLLLLVALNITGGGIQYIYRVGCSAFDKMMHDMTH